ncbi:hypothetical protein K461DRAFT_307474 [Myriangium duriaei CBS 260.36]|uniref:DUF1254 domain-containing protein n=1 Tax=Myriangium duriaei CBS 260.36 TaxID=1168546 RepID=A0A9P4J2C2_9PEZI|nr:hypothetical protein K461DRAFT_307474 [Myriangium duriaei CBS 260.36]
MKFQTCLPFLLGFVACAKLGLALSIPAHDFNHGRVQDATKSKQSHWPYAPGTDCARGLLREYGLPLDTTGATAFALLYGIPLIYYTKEFDGAQGLSMIGVNHVFAQTTAATANTTEIVHPNADTLYALAAIDLSRTNVVLTLPEMEADRLYLLAFWDAYGSQFAALGSIQGSAAGTYLMEPSLGNNNWGVHNCSGYAGCITSPSTLGTLLVRAELKNDSTDLDYVKTWVSQVMVKEFGNHTALRPALSPADFANLSNDTSIQTLQLTARLNQGNPPWQKDLAAGVSQILEMAGICRGTYNQPSSVNLTLAEELFSATVNASPSLPGTYRNENNGWSIIEPSEQGIFHNNTDFRTRAYFGIKAYLDNTAQSALYPMPTQNSFNLTSDSSIVLTFSGKPPIGDNGFWSITAYNSAGFLISNSLNKYTVGDRSNITYPDGTLIYPNHMNSTGQLSTENKPFQVLIQGEDQPPPSNWTANWLPVPSNGSDFTLTFRLYDPEQALVVG